MRLSMRPVINPCYAPDSCCLAELCVNPGGRLKGNFHKSAARYIGS